MSDVEDWLETHEDDLAEIARTTGLSPPLVHLAAVLVLAGIEDDQISEQLHDVVISLDGKRHPLAGAPSALEEIHRLATST